MGADMVVSNDTGIRHVAIVSNVPTVGIFYREPLYRYWPRYGGHDVALPETDGDPPEVDEVHAACIRVMSDTGQIPDTG
jgi:ADP-heptose:LPS heptosyltransferase